LQNRIPPWRVAGAGVHQKSPHATEHYFRFIDRGDGPANDGDHAGTATAADRRALVELLAAQLVERFGAPDLATARLAAEEEIAFAESLCTHPVGSLIAVHRTATDREVRESFRRLQLREGQGHGKAFSFMEVEDDTEPDSGLSLADLSSEPRHQ